MSQQPRVFITHSTLDRDLAKAIVDVLRRGADVPSDKVFCSSMNGLGVPTGENFLQYIQQQLRSAKLVVPLITPAYLESTFCMWELGASWVRRVETYPIMVSPVTTEDLEGPLKTMHVARLDQDGLNGLASKVAAVMGHPPPQLDVWGPARDRVLKQMPTLQAKQKVVWSRTKDAKLRRAARYVTALKYVHEAMHNLRDAAFVRVRHPSDDINEPSSEFLGQLRHCVTAMAKAFTATTGATCRITIKQVITDEVDGLLYVQDLTRSHGRLSNKKDRIDQNTDFESILTGERNYFTCNDLRQAVKDGAYKNSHISVAGALPYNSTVVWPIRTVLYHAVSAEGPGAAKAGQDLISFLCVDCKESDAFDEDADVQLGAAMADSMYSVLQPYMLH